MSTSCSKLVRGVHPSRVHPVSQGSLCMRGWNCLGATAAFMYTDGGLTSPVLGVIVVPSIWMVMYETLHALYACLGVTFVLLFLILKFQNVLPWNPLGLPGLSGHLAFNTAISFVTNTNWDSYFHLLLLRNTNLNLYNRYSDWQPSDNFWIGDNLFS